MAVRLSTAAAAGLSAALLLAACGDEFDYKISGDRTDGGDRAGLADWDGASTASHDDLLKLQERYQAKVRAESGAVTPAT